MSTLLRTQILAFIIIYLHSFGFFIALAAPVPETFSILRKREPQHDNGGYMKQIMPSRDNKGSNVLVRVPAASSLRGQTPTKSSNASVSAAREALQSPIRRGFFGKIGRAFKKIGKGIGKGIRGAANGVKNAAKKVGGAVGKVAKGAVRGVKNGVKAVGNGVKKAGKWVKANGAKIAKGGLKVLGTVTSVAGRVVNFIPGGKALSKPLKYATTALNAGSDAIKANLGKFGKAMGVMDKIQNPLGTGVAGKVLDAVLKRDGDDGPVIFLRDLGGTVAERDLDSEDLSL